MMDMEFTDERGIFVVRNFSADYTVDFGRREAVFGIADEDVGMWKSALLELNRMDKVLYAASVRKHDMQVVFQLSELLFENATDDRW